MTELPFDAATETGPRPEDWRFIIRLDGGDCKLSRDQALELAKQVRDAIEKSKNQREPVRNHEGQKITVRRFYDSISLDFWSPIHPTRGTGNGLTIAQAQELLHELVAFAEDAARAA